jgi:hypothetical protein
MALETSNSQGYQTGSQGYQTGNGNVEVATQKTINRIKEEYCKKLKDKVSELSETEVTHDGAVMMYEKKKCSFVKTEKNYLLVRNLELKVGVQLMQASAEIKKNVTSYITQNDALVAALRAVVKTAKEAKVKFSELREVADKLDGCRKDSCNSVQIKILGCNYGDDCNDNNKREDVVERPSACKNVCEILDDLVIVPDSLRRDIDIIFNSAAEIVGIQSFSNIKTLDKFQQDLVTNAKDFDDLILLQITNGGLSLKKAQEDLVLQIKNATQSGFALYNKRNEVHTVEETKDYLCHHDCNCMAGCDDENEGDGNNSRLKRCKCDICDICEEVTDIYSVETPQNNQTSD